MKLFVRNKVYLQTYEISFIMHRTICFPRVMHEEILGNDLEIDADNIDPMSFSYHFRERDSIEWIMAQEWLVDFDEYASMPADEIKAIYDKLVMERAKKIDDFNRRSDLYRTKHIGEVRKRFDLLSHQIRSLEDIYKYQKSELQLVLPSAYLSWGSRGKEAYARNNKKQCRFFWSIP